MPNDLTEPFHKAMVDIYRRAKDEAGYTANRFLQMLSDAEGVVVARNLINSSTPSDGYTALWERERLDLTVEYLVLEPQWAPLFTDDERKRSRKRLLDYGYTGELPS